MILLMDGYENNIVAEYIHIFGPPLHRSMSSLYQADEEVSRHAINFGSSQVPPGFGAAPLGDHLHVHLDNVVIDPVFSCESIQVSPGYQKN